MQHIGEKAMDQAAEMIVVYTTLANESDARKLGAGLVEERLAACVNIIPGMVSIYSWQDAIETANEVVMLVKAAKSLEKVVLETMAQRHPYTVPALIVFEPDNVASSFLEWICNQTASRR
jgi:periplasmic divalent cation tolerance protein